MPSMESGTIIRKRPSRSCETPEQIRQRLVAEASARHADLWQYEGHWDSWSLGRIKRDLQWRNYPGVENRMAREGEYVLVDVPRPSSMMGYLATGRLTYTVHLPNSPVGGGRGVDTAVYKADVEVLS